MTHLIRLALNVQSSGMDVEPTGMFQTCHRCGFKERINDLEEKKNED